MSINLLLQNIANIAKACGRRPEEIHVLAVTKYATSSQIEEAYSLGLRDFGESRVQDALQKMEQFPKDIRWHFIGRLQKNKVNKVVGKFHLIHSIDSYELAEKLAQASHAHGITQPILLQTNTSGEKAKSGLTPSAWKSCFDAVLSLPNLEIKGLMTMAPLTDDANLIRECFRRLKTLRDELQKPNLSLPILSMGMSHDYAIAIEEGATLLRIGSALFAH